MHDHDDESGASAHAVLFGDKIRLWSFSAYCAPDVAGGYIGVYR
jgi:hypothetical protein